MVCSAAGVFTILSLWSSNNTMQADELEKIREECLDGKLRCGDCKARTAELMQKYFEDLKDKQVEAAEIAKTIL